MTISHYSNAIVDLMLGWLRGFANWVLRLFNLAGGAGGSPLLWLSQNWLKLLIFFLLLGIVLDRLVWLIRWRPYWVWFRKERVIVNDEKFFADKELFEAEPRAEKHRGALDEQDYVVASTLVERKGSGQSRASVVRGQRRTDKSRMNMKRPSGGDSKAEASEAQRSHETTHAEPRGKLSAKDVPMPTADELFGVDNSRPGVSDFYEDEVFNVSNLPVPDEFSPDERVD